MDPEELLQGVIFQDLKGKIQERQTCCNVRNKMEVTKIVLIFPSTGVTFGHVSF
jgi:hypothetical protein